MKADKHFTTNKKELLDFSKFRDCFIERFGKENIDKIEKVANDLNAEMIKGIYSVKILQYWDRDDFLEKKQSLLKLL